MKYVLDRLRPTPSKKLSNSLNYFKSCTCFQTMFMIFFFSHLDLLILLCYSDRFFRIFDISHLILQSWRIFFVNTYDQIQQFIVNIIRWFFLLASFCYIPCLWQKSIIFQVLVFDRKTQQITNYDKSTNSKFN